MKLATAVTAGIFLLDQASKYAVLHLMQLDMRRVIEIWPPFLTFRMAWNQGVNFGLFSGDDALTRWGLILLSLIISAWVWIWARREAHRPIVQVSVGLLVGGALGNVIDRLQYGAVADFLNMSCCGFQNPYSFNVADIAIFAGAIGLAFFSGGKAPAENGKTS